MAASIYDPPNEVQHFVRQLFSVLSYLSYPEIGYHTSLHGVIKAYPKGVPKSLGTFQEAKLNRGAQN